MNQGNWTVLLLGCLLILALYRRALKSDDFNHWLSRDDYVDFHSRFSYHKAVQEKSALKKITIAVLIGYTLIVTNVVLDYIPGWWVLGTVGFLATYVYWHFESSDNLAYLAVEEDIERRNKSRAELDALKKYCSKLLFASVVISGIWFYQVQRNQSEEKLIAMNEVASLVDSEWCANFADINAYREPDGGFEIIRSGGWPCLSITYVGNITFANKKDTLEMCFFYSLNQSSDGPWNSESTSEFDFRELCTTDGDWFESGLDESSLREEIREDLESDLEALRVKMCSIYGRNLNYYDYSTYCS